MTDPITPVTIPGPPVEPYEAGHSTPLNFDDPIWVQAGRDALTAVNGFPYAGERSEAVMATLRWLRDRPEHARILLGLNGETVTEYSAQWPDGFVEEPLADKFDAEHFANATDEQIVVVQRQTTTFAPISTPWVPSPSAVASK